MVRCNRSKATTNFTNKNDLTSRELEGSDDRGQLVVPEHLTVVRPLGSGNMATVVLARDEKLKRLVAVKTLRKELAEDAVCCKRFEREAQTAARLNHPNIPTIYAVGRLSDDTPYIEMQYVEGRNLKDWIQSRGALSSDDYVNLLKQVAGALQAAHNMNVVHRDVKPSNILVDEQNHVWLCDFGVASIIESGAEVLTRLTRAGEQFGNPAYMSPEQLRAEAVTGLSDVYSLGVMAYEVMTGAGPFDSPEIRDMVAAHLRRPPPKLKDIDGDLPEWLSEIFQRCLAKNPNHRPSARDVLDALESQDTASKQTEQKGAVFGFLEELKSRKVYQAAAAYAASVFLILQVADLTLPAFAASNLYNALVIALLLGFPVVVVIAWAYDWHQGRLVKTADSEQSQGKQKLLMRLGLGVCVIGSVGFAIWLIGR
ncbi:MAG: serine/threonine-protein kinase [Pseudomonadota bacterium]